MRGPGAKRNGQWAETADSGGSLRPHRRTTRSLPAGRRQKKEQEQLLANLKRGTKVLTNAGIVATIVTANDGEDEIVIRSEDTKLRIKRNVVVQVLDASGAAAEAPKQ